MKKLLLLFYSVIGLIFLFYTLAYAVGFINLLLFLFFLLLLKLAIFVNRCLFDSEYRQYIQDKIDSIKKMDIFWSLMKDHVSKNIKLFLQLDEDKKSLDIEDVFMIYVNKLTDGGILTYGDFSVAKRSINVNALDKKIVRKRYSLIKNINILNNMIEEEEKLIKNSLEKIRISFTEIEMGTIQKNLIKTIEIDCVHNLEQLEQCKDLLSIYFDLIKGKEKNGFNIWETMKILKDNTLKFEYNFISENKVNPKTITNLKFAEIRIDDLMIEILCEKLENKNITQKIEKSLKKWQQLHMLKWCMVDFGVGLLDTNIFERTYWRIILFLFLFNPIA